MTLKLIFLDIDGVLNTHNPWPNGYCKIEYALVTKLNNILDSVKDAQIVLSSAWRYTMTTKESIQTLLCCHGGNCHNRIHGMTIPDDEDWHPSDDPSKWWKIGLEQRSYQIQCYVKSYNPSHWAVLDDLPLVGLNGHFIQTDPTVGLTIINAAEIVEMLGCK